MPPRTVHLASRYVDDLTPLRETREGFTRPVSSLLTPVEITLISMGSLLTLRKNLIKVRPAI